MNTTYTYWEAAPANPPLPGTRKHWVLTPVEPVTDILYMARLARAELWHILDELVGDEPGWCMATRAGDPNLTGGPVGQVDVTVADPDSTPTVRYQMSGKPQ